MKDRLILSHPDAPGTPTLRARLAPFRRTIGTTGGLVVATAVSSGTGFVFWWIAARTYPPAAVGLAGAAVSAMLLLSQLSVLGLGTTLAGLLHREPRASSLALTALLAATGAGLAVGAMAAIGAPLISPELAPIGAGPIALALFAVGVGATAMTAVLDQVLVAVLRSSHQLLRNVVFSLSRLAILVMGSGLVANNGMAIYGAWVAGTLLSIWIVGLLPEQRRSAPAVRSLQWTRLRSLTSGALSHHLLNLSRSSSVWLLPILVTTLLSREANAAFYVALLLANFIALVGTSATFTLYVVGARAPHQLWRQMRFTLGLSAVSAVGGTLVMLVGGTALLGAFGPGYAAAAYPTVVVLALSTIPLAVKDHWIALQRVEGSVGRAAAIGIGLLALELAAGALGALEGGLMGLAIARLLALLAQAALMTPVVARAIRRPTGPMHAGPSPLTPPFVDAA